MRGRTIATSGALVLGLVLSPLSVFAQSATDTASATEPPAFVPEAHPARPKAPLTAKQTKPSGPAWGADPFDDANSAPNKAPSTAQQGAPVTPPANSPPAEGWPDPVLSQAPPETLSPAFLADPYGTAPWDSELPATVAAAPATQPPRRSSHANNAIQVGGGVTTFANGQPALVTDVGGYWDVRGVVGTRRIVAVEAAYGGSLQGITSLGLDRTAKIYRHSLEGDLRINAPLVRGAGMVTPFAFGGFGYAHYGLANTPSATSDVGANDDIMTVPCGAGIALGTDGFLLDARYTYRFTYANDLFAARTNGLRGDLNSWGFGINLGREF